MLNYFGFHEEPFGISPDPRCIYLSATHRETLIALDRGFTNNRGFTAMIAPPGMGKTTLLFRFLEEAQETARTVFLFDMDALSEPREFVSYILRDIGITPAQSSAERHQQLSAALDRENQAGRKFVVVIDEAQNLSDAVLERVRLLTNYETTRGKLMHIVLSGQPQLADNLMQPGHVQFRQRITTLCRIEPLSADEIAPYIDYRLKIAGYKGPPLFTNDALNLIKKCTFGTPRIVNNLCFSTLSLCHMLKSKQVDIAMVARVIDDLRLTPRPQEPIAVTVNVGAEQPVEAGRFKRPKPLLKQLIATTTGSVLIWVPVAVLLATGVLGVFRATGAGASQPHTTVAGQSLRKAQPAPVTTPTAGTGETGNTVPLPNASPTQPTSSAAHLDSAPSSGFAHVPMQFQIPGSVPKPSPANAHPAAASIGSPITQASLTRQASTVAQPSSTDADGNPGQNSASAGQSSLPAKAQAASAAKQVRPALEGSAPLVIDTAPDSNVHPALPGLNPQ